MLLDTDRRSRRASTAAPSVGVAGCRPGLVGRVTRCMGVSIVTTVISVTILAATTAGLGWAAWVANVTATAVATVPSYHLNRRWTWGKRDASSLWREIMPFWVLSFAGLVLSTIAVALTASWTSGVHFTPPLLHTVVLVAAHLSGFALLWVAQFVLLEKVLFADRGPTFGAGAGQLEVATAASGGFDRSAPRA
jgi:putative flippase GtrA